MENTIVVGIDLAKNIFQLHGTDSVGKVLFKKKVRRNQLLNTVANLPQALIGMEACASSHYWAREFAKFGHTVKLMAPQYVKPYVKTNKNDAADAEAICEAVTRKNMRFVAPKSIAAQDLQSIHRARKRLSRNVTGLVNEIRGLLSEYGIVMAPKVSSFRSSVPQLLENEALSDSFKRTLRELYEEFVFMDEKLKAYDRRLKDEYNAREICQNLGTIKGIGIITATALATVDPTVFKNGRQFAAWLGLTPKQHSSGGKEKLLGISKRGDTYLRELLVHGARVFLRWSDKNTDKLSIWARELKLRRGHNKACVAVANKLARISWAIMTGNREFEPAY
jgi:transposase